MTSEQESLAVAISRLVYCNPFLPERIEAEREALGHDFTEHGADWNQRNDWDAIHPNVALLQEKAAALADVLRKSHGNKPPRGARERETYEGVVLFYLFHLFRTKFDQTVEAGLRAGNESRKERVGFYGEFREQADRYLVFGEEPLFEDYRPEHVFAFFFQIRRAFFQIFRHLAGGSRPITRLRAAIWQSIFTHDLRRYRRTLYNRMEDMTTLIIGPTGSGKELAARAIGLSRFIPFDSKSRAFEESFAGSFYPLNLAALSPTLIESELFGHRKGAFTGALQDREGWLEACGPHGAVFLDEIGEVDPSVQVKLLRVLQARTFSRIGETTARKFEGKIIAATNRDLAGEMKAGNFREDFYYRLCSDVVRTPPLAEQLADSPGDLENLVAFTAARIVGSGEAPAFTREATAWMAEHLPPDHPWPGNFRELEQCLRGIALRGTYEPGAATRAEDDLAAAFAEGRWTAAELLSRYSQLLHRRYGTYEEVSRRLQLDRRTVRKHIHGNGGDS